jgi:hypothetical protein
MIDVGDGTLLSKTKSLFDRSVGARRSIGRNRSAGVSKYTAARYSPQ